MKRKFHIMTFGCQMNEYDSQIIEEMLEANGYVSVNVPEEADVVIINGCVVRAKPEIKELELAKRYKHLGKTVVITGCLAQKDYRLLKNIADAIIGPMQYDRLLEAIERGKVFTDFHVYRDHFYKVAKDRKNVNFSEYITIMTGCDNFCSYCVVPFTRGREVSRSPEDIIEEAQNLLKKGVVEITLIGQNVNSYFYKGVEFKDLLKRMAQLPVRRVRFTTSHPRDIVPEIFKIMAQKPNIMPWLHLPVQTGSDRLLYEMNRGYLSEEYIEIVNLARRIVPSITISTDIMVGYPTETEEDFQATLKLVETVEFDYAYMFIYSPRKPSKAFFRYGDQTVPQEIAVARHRRLVESVNRIVRKKREQMVGKEYEILVDGHSKKDPELSRGKTPGNITVVIDRKLPPGSFVRVKVVEIRGITPYGKVLKIL